MVSRSEMASRSGAVVPASSAVAPIRSKLPPSLRFALLIVLSASLNLLGLSLASNFMGYELGSVSRVLKEPWQLAAVVVWRTAEIGTGWWAGFDDLDTVALTALTHAPHLFLLNKFYGITPTTTLLALVVDVFSISIPTFLLRPRAPQHNIKAPSAAVPNKAIINDFGVRFSTSCAAAAVYAVILYGSLRTWLPLQLAVHFTGLKSLEPAHGAKLPNILALMIPVGWAARSFLLTSSLAAQTSLADISHKHFNPETASLENTITWNLGMWGWSKTNKVLTQRALFLSTAVLANGAFRTFTDIDGSDLTGAIGWAGTWAVAGLASAALFGWIEDV